ncbi:hypothetical protein BDV59DRAFT_39480 [Aspergillus ambiguus]|uniref:putative Rho guanyl nucleotide exchange factor n=1 Tax=Aspergillus ambiguus TaxID=176160 RepID=UPI003CCE1C80
MDSLRSSVSTDEAKEEISGPLHDPVAEPQAESTPIESSDPSPRNIVFRRWVKSLRRRRPGPLHQPVKVIEGWSDGSHDGPGSSRDLPPNDMITETESRLSGQSSNLGTIKTSTLSITSRSMVMSGGTTHSTNRSVKSDFRESVESSRPQRLSIDAESHNRAINRYRAIRELIATETEYVFGLKALTDVLYLFSSRSEIHYNLQSIRALHEKFLANIRKLSPSVNIHDRQLREPPQTGNQGVATTQEPFQVLRYRSSRKRQPGSATSRCPYSPTAGTNEAFEIALEIQQLSTSFKAYEHYFRNYQQLTEDVDLLRQSIPNWPIFNQGIEALSRSVASIETRSLNENKAMSLNDMVIKRICRYELLLNELLKYTHIQDDPPAHSGINQILDSVRDIVRQVNSASANPMTKTYIRRTVLLQNMIDLPGLCSVHDIYQNLGPMCLCGVLHVTCQLSGHVTGIYMACVLFQSHFLLAMADYASSKLRGVACLYVCDMKIDTLSNGRGICCHGSLFTWKMCFQFDGNDFELVLSASSANDEKNWKSEFLKSTAFSSETPKSVALEMKEYNFLSLDLTPLNRVYNPEKLLPRTPSVHSASVPRLDSNLQHVVIKKTHCPHHVNQMPRTVEGEIERPKMLSSPALVLTSRRQDRIRLEKLISCIYTRELLNYPGMTLTRNEMLFGPAFLMRRLSLRTAHKRSASSGLPSTKPGMDHENGVQHAKMKSGDSPNGKRRNPSERGPKLNREMVLSPWEFTLGTSRRAKILKLGKRAPPTSEFAVLESDLRNEYHHEGLPKVSLRTVFNTMSLRRSRRDIHWSLDSGA